MRDGGAAASPPPQPGGQLGEVAAAGGDEQVAGEVGDGADGEVGDQRRRARARDGLGAGDRHHGAEGPGGHEQRGGAGQGRLRVRRK